MIRYEIKNKLAYRVYIGFWVLGLVLALSSLSVSFSIKELCFWLGLALICDSCIVWLLGEKSQ